MSTSSSARSDTFHNYDTHPQAFPRLTEAQIAQIAAVGTRVAFAAGEVLFEQGERGYNFHVILSGRVLVMSRGADGDRLFAEHGPGEFTGDMGTITRQAAIGAGVADGPVEAIHLDRTQLQRVLAADSVLGPLVLQAFLLRRSILEETGYHYIRLVGSRWSEATQELRSFLSSNRILYRWVDPEADAEAEALLETLNLAPGDLPAVVSHHFGVLSRPTVRQLARTLGVSVALEQATYDLVVVGGGPAGLAAAVYGASEGLSTLLVEQTAPGGQAGTSSKIENYLGFPTGLSGRELADRATAQAHKFGVHVHAPAGVAGLTCEGGERQLILDDEAPVRGRTIVVATGATYRRLQAPGAEQFVGTGILYAATASEADLCRHSDVIVVGGGNSAGQAAVFLAQHARHVRMVVRSESLADSMSRYLIDRIEQTPTIDLLLQTEITAFHGDDGRLEAVTLSGPSGDEVVGTSAVFAMIGATPNTRWLDGCLGLDGRGFIVTGEAARRHETFAQHWAEPRAPHYLETTRPGVFAAGDVRAGSVKRVASAVGEGSMAVAYVHDVLAAPAAVPAAPVSRTARG